jgi:hypothetical protein
VPHIKAKQIEGSQEQGAEEKTQKSDDVNGGCRELNDGSLHYL